MNKFHSAKNFKPSQEIWQAAERLAAPRASERDAALDYLVDQGAVRISPLIVYLLATRISDPDLDVRSHIVKALGGVVAVDGQGEHAADQVIIHLQGFLAQINKEQVLSLLEVSNQYLTAEESLIEIFKLCSYAGDKLGGIVNDQKQPLSIRQKAIYFCGEVGFLESVSVLRELTKRVEKRNQNQSRTHIRKRAKDEEQLYPYAIVALDKLDNRFPTGRK
jgi:HEAT repeat protein